MITKGIVQEIIDPYNIKLRLPILDGTDYSSEGIPNEYLNTAIVCLPPKTQYNFEIGDVVIVGFEDDDLSKPIIIGCLFKQDGNTSTIDIQAQELSTTNAILGKNTYIGNVTPKEISSLEGVTGNIQLQINHILELIESLKN